MKLKAVGDTQEAIGSRTYPGGIGKLLPCRYRLTPLPGDRWQAEVQLWPSDPFEKLLHKPATLRQATIICERFDQLGEKAQRGVLALNLDGKPRKNSRPAEIPLPYSRKQVQRKPVAQPQIKIKKLKTYKLRDKRERGSPQRDAARAWLVDYLADGPKASIDVMEAGTAAGHIAKHLYTARVKTGSVIQWQGNVTVWHGPRT